MKLYRIVAPHFVAGIELSYNYHNKKTLYGNCAPILNWVQRSKWGFTQLSTYCGRKGWKLELLSDKEE